MFGLLKREISNLTPAEANGTLERGIGYQIGLQTCIKFLESFFKEAETTIHIVTVSESVWENAHTSNETHSVAFFDKEEAKRYFEKQKNLLTSHYNLSYKESRKFEDVIFLYLRNEDCANAFEITLTTQKIKI